MRKKFGVVLLIFTFVIGLIFPTGSVQAAETYPVNFPQFGSNCQVRLNVDKLRYHKTDKEVIATGISNGKCSTMYYKMVLSFPGRDYKTYSGYFTDSITHKFDLSGLHQNYTIYAKVFLFLYTKSNYTGLAGYLEMPITIFPRGDYDHGYDSWKPIE